MNRRAMSPLIATVLLIAFAVALGAMIMNWSAGVPEPTDTWRSSSSPCDSVKLELSEAFGKPLFCYSDGAIKFNILNVGTKEISAIEIRTLNSELKEVKQLLPNSKMLVGETFSDEVTFDKSGKVHVELVPQIVVDDATQFCQKQAIIQDVLSDCEN